MHASSGSVSGNLVSSGINASNITSGRLNIDDGRGHYLRMGFGEGDNPSVSGLNVYGNGGINLHGNAGISGATSLSVYGTGTSGYGYYTGKSTPDGINIRDGNGGVWSLTFVDGLLVASSYIA